MVHWVRPTQYNSKIQQINLIFHGLSNFTNNYHWIRESFKISVRHTHQTNKTIK